MLPTQKLKLKRTINSIFGYVKIKYSDKMDSWVGGLCTNILFFPISFIKIRPKYKNDLGLHIHELTHAKQHRRYFCLQPLLYTFSKKYRLKFETEAYIEQLKCYDNPESCMSWLPDSLYLKYALFETKKEAVEYVRSKILPKVLKKK